MQFIEFRNIITQISGKLFPQTIEGNWKTYNARKEVKILHLTSFCSNDTV
ncbi:MAG: hypothetical protein ACJAWV_002121 [Flammeovirgaceae bacterium]|jgi:hypothetical protein